ncbi:LepB protein [Legionella steigerwaltii]|uniref:Effector protein B, substrate of the Dot/Icm secretion system n=1 Tax=Legionella steigerwaltii TaxID=460 RepID=A0A378LI99_9GAMM|nr:LepB GTPase-activating domain-containing protein [Legionella steigerwaltii]KTD71663.1 effector protein B, substrate of the Dot/Icm secretion system [Legionella steigerwaltii]STY23831.1 LepB protein [Legionella steigerwaltii]
MPDKKFDILSYTIDQDQVTVANQWADTFIYNSKDDIAANMSQLLLACLACGDFKTRTYLSRSSELQAPSDQLTIADYLSHASRIVLDYQELTETNRKELLNYFPTPGVKNTVFSRSATHNVSRNIKGTVIEGKGVLLGLAGQLPSLIKTPQDFGINIAMGGMGKTNFYGNKISDNGCSGHLYFHRNDSDNLLLFGLEQTAPPASALEFLLGAKKYPEEVQQNHDQFGQGHSLKGASDTYTAAGSLYFSDPVYQAKLLLEKGVFPPDKYGAMQVTITDENWPYIKQFLGKLKATLAEDESHKKKLLELLLSKPATATAAKREYLSYIALDFDSYLKRIYQIFIVQSQLDVEKQLTLFNLQSKLLATIKQLQQGHIESYETFKDQITEIIETKDTQPEYQRAILRIQNLFELQLEIDPKFKQTHEELLLKNLYDDLQEESKIILERLLGFQRHFQELPNVNELESPQRFLQQIEMHIKALQNPFSTISEEIDLSSSWVMCESPASITMDSIEKLKQTIEDAKSFTQPITLTSKDALSFSELISVWEEKLLPFTQINLIDYREFNLSDLAKQFNEYVDTVAQQSELFNFWNHQPLQTTNLFVDFFTKQPEYELGHDFVVQYRESTLLKRLFYLDPACLNPLDFKPYKELNAEYKKHHPNSYWCKVNELLAAGHDIIRTLCVLKTQQNAKSSWEDMSHTVTLFRGAIEQFKKTNKDLQHFHNTAQKSPVEVFESPFFYALNNEALQKMNGVQLAAVCLEELNATAPSVLVKRITNHQALWQRMDQSFQSEEFKFKKSIDVEKKILSLRQIRYFWELVQQFQEQEALENKKDIFVTLQSALKESSSIFGAAEAIENAQKEMGQLQEYVLQQQNLATEQDKAIALSLLEEKHNNLPEKQRKHYESQLIQAKKDTYQFYLEKINASQNIEERKTLFTILNQLFGKLPPDVQKQFQMEHKIKQIENILYGYCDRLKNATTVTDKKRIFDDPILRQTIEDFESLTSPLISESAKKIHKQLTQAKLIYEKLLDAQLIGQEYLVKPLDTLINQFAPILDNIQTSLHSQLIGAALNDNTLHQAILKKVGNKKFTSVLIRDLLTLKEFREKKIELSKKKKYGNEYDQSINQFYEEALNIRLSGLPVRNQADGLMKAATHEFSPRHDTRRLIADIAMIVTAFFGIGFFVGLGRLAAGKTLFFSSAKTDREVEFGNQWLCKYKKLPPTEESETQLLTAPAA